MNSEVGVHILIGVFMRKISALSNQNILLEENLNIQNKYDELKNYKKIEK